MTAPEAPREWVIKRYEDGDEAAILALFNREFGLERSLEHWRWQFKRNPYGGPFASQARRKSDGALLGTHVVMPFQLNVKGRPVLAAQTLDLVVHPEYRRQGIFESTARDCFESFKPADVRAVVAFPNTSSYPGFVRTLGWMRLLTPTHFALRLDLTDALGGKLPLRWVAKMLNAGFRFYLGLRLGTQDGTNRRSRNGGIRHDVSTKVPEGYDRLWEKQRSQEVLSIWKDSRYFAWRYDENPDHDFTYHSLMREGEMIALAVAVERDRTITLCELIVADRDVATGRRLIQEIGRFYFGRRARAIHFLGHDRGFFAAMLSGFRSRPATENVFVGRALEDPELNELMSHQENWTITFGDADFV